MSDETTTVAPPEPAAKPKKLSRAESTCSIEGCKRPYRAKTYCNVHYKLWRRGGMEKHTSRYKICTKEGCRKPRFVGSLCEDHSKAAKAEDAAA